MLANQIQKCIENYTQPPNRIYYRYATQFQHMKIKVIHHISRLEKSNHMIISTVVEKACDKILHIPIHVRNSQ